MTTTPATAAPAAPENKDAPVKKPGNKLKIGGIGFGKFMLAGAVGAVIAYLKTPVFVLAGWAGVGKSLLVGAGTAIGGALMTVPGSIAGGIIGGFIGYSTGSRKTATRGAAVGAIVGGLVGAGYGVSHGYDLSKQWLLEGTRITETFNDASTRKVLEQQQTPALTPKPPSSAYAPG